MDFLQDLHRWKIAQEEARRKHIFISKTEELRRMMVHVQLTQPYREEQVCEGVIATATVCGWGRMWPTAACRRVVA